MGPRSGKGLKAYAKKSGYVVHPLQVRALDNHRFQIETPGKPTFLKFVAKEKLSWVLYDEKGALAEGTLPKPYVRFQCEAYLSPNRRLVLVNMSVNTGWYQDVFMEAARLRP
jgi:hypothetical protein